MWPANRKELPTCALVFHTVTLHPIITLGLAENDNIKQLLQRINGKICGEKISLWATHTYLFMPFGSPK